MEFVGKIKKLLPIVSGKSQKGTAWKKHCLLYTSDAADE